jgi:alkanesulfonate monooxygenase SsuD/methylene tetrahydromethanopterin reductase-like flavin-dependent oxidoreductase (luciferase family)
MDLGYYVLNTYVPELDGSAEALYGRYLEQVAVAEAAGFGTVWVTEHHFREFGGMVPSPQLLLSAISQRSRRLRLGTSVTLLPLHHPLRVAEDFAMLDVLSGGRLEFGVGRGMALSGYEGFGQGWQDAQERMKEALALIVEAWTRPTVRFDGRYYRCPEVRTLPRPVQQPHPPIWVTASVDPESFRWVGAQGYDLMILPWLFPGTPENVALYHEARAAAGHAGPGRVMAMYPTHIAESEAEARVHAAPAWDRWREFLGAETKASQASRPTMPPPVARTDYEFMVGERRVPLGSVERAVATARWAASVGVTHLGLTFHFAGIDHSATLRAIELWGRAVAPALRTASGAAEGAPT